MCGSRSRVPVHSEPAHFPSIRPVWLAEFMIEFQPRLSAPVSLLASLVGIFGLSQWGFSFPFIVWVML